MKQCECGCGQWFERQAKKGAPVRFIPGHQFRTPENQAAYLAGKQRQRALPPADYPNDGLCQCGCGQQTTLAEETARARNWYKGFPKPFIHGHNRRGKPHPKPRPKPERIVENGYVYVLSPDHPNVPKDGYMLEHRLVWEQAHGRLLDTTMTVHHINGIRDDNRPENLVALTRSEHQRLHRQQQEHPK